MTHVRLHTKVPGLAIIALNQTTKAPLSGVKSTLMGHKDPLPGNLVRTLLGSTPTQAPCQATRAPCHATIGTVGTFYGQQEPYVRPQRPPA